MRRGRVGARPEVLLAVASCAAFLACRAPRSVSTPIPRAAVAGVSASPAPSASSAAPTELPSSCKTTETATWCTVRTIDDELGAKLDARPNRANIGVVLQDADDAALASLAKIPWLTKLQILPGDGVTDLAPLASLRDLIFLDLFRTKAKTLAPLAALKKLEQLVLAYMPELTDVDLRVLSGLTALRSLELRALATQRLDGIDALDLETLQLLFARFTSLAPLHGMAHLSTLVVMSPIDAVDALPSLPSLRFLVLENVPAVKDFSPIGRVTGLVGLSITDAHVKDLAFVGKLPALEGLTLRRALETNVLAPLAAEKKLASLDLTGAKIKGLAPIAALPELRELELAGSTVKDVKPLAASKSLRYVGLNDTSVHDVMPLAAITTLSRLFLPRDFPTAALDAFRQARPDVRCDVCCPID